VNASTLLSFLMAAPFCTLVVIALLYNSLVARRNAVKNVFACLDALLQKRADLVPNLVATVKGAMNHEAQLLAEIARLRSLTLSGGAVQRAQADEKLSDHLSQLLVLAESYPTLQVNRNFLQLQASLNEIEEQISAARRAYNAAVTDYNNGVEMLPTSIVAGWMKLQKQPWFEAAAGSRANVNVAAQMRG